MNEYSNFFSDPKVILALLALVVSIFNLIWMLANQSEQNRRWEKLNAANPEIKEIKMVSFKEVGKDEAMSTTWGYKPEIYAKGEASNVFFLPFYLSLHDSITNEVLKNANPVFTIGEVETEVKRIGHPNKVFVFKHFRPKFIIENMGNTSADNLAIRVDAKKSENEWQQVFNSTSKITLAGGQQSTFFIDFELPAEIEVPKQFNFRLSLEWINIHGKIESKIINTKWTSDDNFWSYDLGE
ncbi:hypothetical protein PQG22_09050 [Aquirufa beregesia]